MQSVSVEFAGDSGTQPVGTREIKDKGSENSRIVILCVCVAGIVLLMGMLIGHLGTDSHDLELRKAETQVQLLTLEVAILETLNKAQARTLGWYGVVIDDFTGKKHSLGVCRNYGGSVDSSRIIE